MSVSGLCDICQSATAVDRCDRCGTMVCDEHFEEEMGICLECRAEYPGEGGTGTGTQGRDDHPDVDRYRF